METEKKYIFQCGLCKVWGKGGSDVRVFEKQVPYEKENPPVEEKEGELVLCVSCYKKLK